MSARIARLARLAQAGAIDQPTAHRLLGPRRAADAQARLLALPAPSTFMRSTDLDGPPYDLPTLLDQVIDWAPVRAVEERVEEDAQADCASRTRADGAPSRLPTEVEWDAARGVDGRLHHTDRSPRGVEDMAGGVRRWTATAGLDDRCFHRGSGDASPAPWRRATNRGSNNPEFNSIQCGFRVVRALPKET